MTPKQLRDAPDYFRYKFLPELVKTKKFTGVKDVDGNRLAIGTLPCLVCGELGQRDKFSKLCRPCWRITVLASFEIRRPL